MRLYLSILYPHIYIPTTLFLTCSVLKYDYIFLSYIHISTSQQHSFSLVPYCFYLISTYLHPNNTLSHFFRIVSIHFLFMFFFLRLKCLRFLDEVGNGGEGRAPEFSHEDIMLRNRAGNNEEGWFQLIYIFK